MTIVGTKWILDPLAPTPPPGPAPRGYIKIPNVFRQSSSIGLWGYCLWKFRDSSLKWSRSNGVTFQTVGRTDGRGYHNIPAFSSKSAGIITNETALDQICPYLNCPRPNRPQVLLPKRPHKYEPFMVNTLWKHAYSNILKILHQKMKIFRQKILIFFILLLKT